MACAAGVCIDDLDIAIANYEHPQPELLRADAGEVVEEALHSHLLKSNCPVTSQPDWGTLVVEYKGARLDHASFLAYIVSFRQHCDFHEQCVERVFLDLKRLLNPEYLTVHARYAPGRAGHQPLPQHPRAGAGQRAARAAVGGPFPG